METRYWTDEDELYLKNHSKNKTVDELASQLNRTCSSIWHKLTRLSLHPKSKNKKYYNTNFFKKWSDDMAYVLGYWFADGCICSSKKRGCNFQIASNDFEILQKIKVAMNSEHKIVKHDSVIKKSGKISHGYIFKLNGKEIYNDMIRLGGTERKSFTAKFPYVPKKYIKHFIRGFFDGDGSIYNNHNNFPQILFLGTKKFLTVLMNYLPYKTFIYERQGVYSIGYTGKKAQDILKFMYGGSKLYLDRKYKSYLVGMKWKLIRNTNNKWSGKDLEILQNYYGKYGVRISEKIEKHDDCSIRSKASELGLKYFGNRYWKKTYWTEKEIDILIKNYAEKGPNISELLKHHTVNAIVTKACILRRKKKIPLSLSWQEDHSIHWVDELLF